MPRRKPEDIDLGAIKTDLEFLIERGERLRREQALKPLYTMAGVPRSSSPGSRSSAASACEI
jgi:hypothetical protein